MKHMKELLKKKMKEGDMMSEAEKKASLEVLGDLSSQAEEAMGSKLMLQAEDKEEAEEMLGKAEEALESMPDDESEEDEESDEDEMPGDELEDKLLDFSDLSMEEIEDQIMKLQKMKMKKMESDAFGVS